MCVYHTTKAMNSQIFGAALAENLCKGQKHVHMRICVCNMHVSVYAYLCIYHMHVCICVCVYIICMHVRCMGLCMAYGSNR